MRTLIGNTKRSWNVAIASLALTSITEIRCSLVEPYHRDLDIVPVESRVEQRLPSGMVASYFSFDAGGDQFLNFWEKMDVGLVLNIEYDSKHFRQTVASCDRLPPKAEMVRDEQFDYGVVDFTECDSALFVICISINYIYTYKMDSLSRKESIVSVSKFPDSYQMSRTKNRQLSWGE